MKKVSVYSTPNCKYCAMAKEYFKENNVAFEEFNVAVDREKQKQMIEMSGQMGVPVITIDNDLVIGFNKPVIADLLGIK